jgi:hypothetical protein
MNKAAEDRSRGCLHLLQAQADLTHVESVHEARQIQIADVKAASKLADERYDGEKRRMFNLKQVFAQGVEAMRVKYPPGGLDAEILAELASVSPNRLDQRVIMLIIDCICQTGWPNCGGS